MPEADADTLSQDRQAAPVSKQAEPTSVLALDQDLVPIREIQKYATHLYNIFSDSTRGQECEKLIWKIKEALKAWSAWQEKITAKAKTDLPT